METEIMALFELIKRPYNFIKDLIYPPFCFFCKDFLQAKQDTQNRQVFCKKCYNAITPVVTSTIEVTKKYKIKVFAISDYKNPIRSLILAKGSSDILSAQKLGELIWELTYLKNAEFDYIVPIALHWRRYAQRGFNQASEIARAISKKSGKPVIDLLKRTKSTRRQSELVPSKRLLNVHDAFELDMQVLEKNLGKYKNKKILLVDDLMTTGATLKSAAKVLIVLKPKSIVAAVASRVV
ncbi:ComF family protein [Candidatus Dependentiae bacterium]